MKKYILWAVSCVMALSCAQNEVIQNTIRPSAYPLVTIDPYTSAWSPSDNLYDSTVEHWTGKPHSLIGVLKVDGEVYRFLGRRESDFETLVPDAKSGAWESYCTFEEPQGEWTSPAYKTVGWKRGKGGFGTEEMAGAVTRWSIGDLWVRRSFVLDELPENKVFVRFSANDSGGFSVNGQEIYNRHNTSSELMVEVPREVLKKGENVIAAHAFNKGGRALLDFSVLVEIPAEDGFCNTAQQLSADVQSMQTKYAFECGPVDLKLTFTAPLFLDNLDLVSRPVNYITYEVSSKDGQKHDVQVYFEAAPSWALNTPDQPSVSETVSKGSLKYLRAGSLEQNILGRKGDDVRIDWGHFYLAAEPEGTSVAVGEARTLADDFLKGRFADMENASCKDASMALVRDLGKVTSSEGKVLIGYDDIYSIQYFGDNLRPYWNRNGDKTIFDQFEAALKDYDGLMDAAADFDRRNMADAIAAGGRKYAELCVLAYRQAVAAHKLVRSQDGELLWLSKENFSNGSIGTVDITYPSAPMFLLYNPELVKGMMNQIFYYSESGKWTERFPAHDVGTYPLANGQTYGGAVLKHMPVEESGNMLILSAAVAMIGNDTGYIAKHWDCLTTWAHFLAEHGLDPENQLCTDDFAGHLAHNVNLSAKAILGIASYGKMAGMLGKTELAQEYMDMAADMASQWTEMAADGDHFKLTFDRPGTWSQKYNLVWDKILGFNIFDPSIAEKELEYYKTRQNVYGLPLDSRSAYTKTDWIIWTATLADDMETFTTFVDPIWKFMNETTDRVPMSDWIWTDVAQWRGFKARSVVGGYYMPMLKNLYKK